MEFTTPTTKTELYTVLGQIFYYYRIRRETYTDVSIPQLDLDTLQFTSLTSSQINQKATKSVLATQLREKQEYLDELNSEIAKLQALITAENSNITTLVANATAQYTASERAVENEATKKGLSRSSIVVDKLSELEDKKNAKILELQTESANKIANYGAQITALQTKISNVDTRFSSIFSAEVDATVDKLTDDQAKIEREVFKYNNAIDEKIQRYNGSIINSNANLRMKYLQIKGEFFTKDELVEMGYYNDVMDCINGFYSSYTALNAYRDIIAETKLAIYLDDYYEDFVYMYKSRAGL